MTVKIDKNKLCPPGCVECLYARPGCTAIDLSIDVDGGFTVFIDDTKCVEWCSDCVEACPEGAITMEED